MRELYAVKFDKCVTQTDVFFTTYEVDKISLPSMRIPVKIELIKDDTRILTTFKGHPTTYHEIGYDQSVELFWREVEETKTEK